jgi:putative transposase
MPRKPRVYLAGGFYHVILRGNSRQNIFDEPVDREIWEHLLDQALGSYDHRLHAYCWMTNHVHMAIQAGSESLAGFMSYLAGNYARRMNIRKQRSGHLFERRYRAILVQAESYLLQLVRYIHMNPVRAGITETPIEYRWSSHRAYLGGNRPEWLMTDTVLAFFAGQRDQARRQYARFMQEPADESICDELRGKKTILGDAGWLEKTVLAMSGCKARQSLDELVAMTCAKYEIDETQLASPARSHAMSRIRAEIAITAVRDEIASITAVARRFNRKLPSLLRAVKNLLKNRR